MYQLLKPFLFLLSPERAHYFTLRLFRVVLAIPIVNALFRSSFRYEDVSLEREVFGLKFKNPVGLAAGFDKDGKAFREMAELGFGFVEVGTVTPLPQVGNPQPRLFRLPKDEALINRMGFNNAGMEAMVEQLKKGKPEGLIVGGNIGKNKATSNESAVDDYVKCFECLFPYVDYFVVNVSSPNTPNLRALQDKEPLTHLLSTLQKLNKAKPNPKPMLLKIAPDLSFGQIDDIIDIVQSVQLDGVIATNTTIDRSTLTTDEASIQQIGNGGLSGQPLTQRATEIIRYIHERTNGTLTIIGVGGIASPKDALEKLQAGATLVQIYTGLVYEGPYLVKQIKQAIA